MLRRKIVFKCKTVYKQNMLPPFSIKLLALAWLILDNHAEHVKSFEPITTSIAVGFAAIGSLVFVGFDTVKCKTTECCTDSWINPNFTGKGCSMFYIRLSLR